MPKLGAQKDGWTKVMFGDVVRQVKDKVDPWDSGLERYVAGEHMDTDELKIRRWGSIGDDYLGPAFHMRFKPGQVLYGSRRTYLRKVAVADFEGITANTTFVLESKDPKKLLPELLPFIMQTESFHEHSIRESKGSVNPYVNFTDLIWYEFGLPHIKEQRRLAKLLASINALKNIYFETIQQGRLLVKTFLEHISEKCEPVRLGELVERGMLAPPQDGNHGEKHPRASDYVDNGIPFVMASDLKDGMVDFFNCKKIRINLAKTLRIGFAKPGDILISHKGDPAQF